MRVSRFYIKYLFLLIPFLLSVVVFTQTNNDFANVLLFFKLIVFICITVEHVRNAYITKFDCRLGFYFFVRLISVLINSAEFIGFVKEAVVIVSLVFIIEDSFKKGEGIQLVHAFKLLLLLELIINLGCMIIFPEGIWQTYSIYGNKATYSFLGLPNQMTPIFIVAELVLLLTLYCDGFHFKLRTVIFAIVLIGNVLLAKSATGIIGCILIPLTLIIGVRYKKIINLKTILIAVACVFLLIVVFRKQVIFSWIIEGILDKDLTFTNRIEIWDRAIELILQKPLLGFGCGTMDPIIGDRNAHDFYLQLILQSGIVGICVYGNMFRIAVKKCLQERNTTSSLIISSTLFGYLICGISEVYAQSWLFIILTFGYNVNVISKWRYNGDRIQR